MAKVDDILKGLLQINPMYGVLLQQLKIIKSKHIPTAGVGINNYKKFILMYNQDFLNKLTLDQSIAVFKHEAMHFTHNHILMGLKYKNEDRKLLNIAMDMVINQFIKNLPDGCSQCPANNQAEPCPNDKCPGKCIKIENFVDVNDKPLDVKHLTEYYYEKLKQRKEKHPENKLTDKNGNVWDDSFDAHEWFDNLTDAEKEEIMKELKSVLKRTKEKTAEMGAYDTNVKEIDDILQEIDAEINNLNYAKLLESAIKRSLPSSQRINTWKRPSRRYGYEAKGTKADEKPRIDVHLDSSGSISVTELNKFLKHTDKFAMYANKKCNLNLFHETVYHTQKYRVGQKLEPQVLQSGGTDLTPVLENIKKSNPDLAIIFTDGFYGDVQIKGIGSKILFVISKEGTEDHPLKRYGTTVKLPN